MVKNHAKTEVLELTANIPKTHVMPSRGSKITLPFKVTLCVENKEFNITWKL